MSREFYEARRLFINHINYTKPYSYEEWVSLPEDHKTVALYIQYFNEIILAWYKTKSFYASEEEGVETVLQYLNKNVPILEANEKKFNERYIYRVAYNCLYCISHDRLIDKARYELETSNICATSDGEINIFDMVEDGNASFEFDLSDRAIRSKFWEIVDSDPDMAALVNNILNGERLGFRGKRKEAAMENLKSKLEVFKVYFYND